MTLARGMLTVACLLIIIVVAWQVGVELSDAWQRMHP